MDYEINLFMDYLKKVKHYSKATISSYFFDLNKFSSYLNENNLKVNEVKKEDVLDYMNNLKINHYKATSINRKIVCLRSFYKFYVNEVDNSFINPLINYQSLKTPKRLPKDLFKEQVNILLHCIENKPHYAIRNQCIVLLLLNTGMRVSELCNLNVDDLDLKENCIRVFGKGKKERMVFFLPSVNKYLIEYLNKHRNQFLPINDSKALFLSNKGSRITPRAIENILNYRAKQSSQPFKVTPHMLRHTFATSLLNNDMDLKMLQELLGHSSLAATQVYTHVSAARLKKVYDNSHPMAKLNKK